MTTTDPKEPNPPSETPSEPPNLYDYAEVEESAALEALQKLNKKDREKSRQKSPPHLRLVKPK